MTAPRSTSTLARNHGAPGQARALLREHADSLDRDRLDTAVLLISELVTNAVLHGGGEIRLTIDVNGGDARFAVGDEGSGRPWCGRARARRRLGTAAGRPARQPLGRPRGTHPGLVRALAPPRVQRARWRAITTRWISFVPS